MASITATALRKAFGDFVAVEESDFTIADGEFFVMLGPSGCGKTTTLRMIAGLEFATSGTIKLDDKDVTDLPASARDIAFVFQLFALYPHMGVRGNIGFPLKCQGMPAAEVRKRVDDAMRVLRIGHLADSRLSALSGGDRQRVALGRAIVREPEAFLLDEPLGALDAEMRQVMCGELRTLHDRLGTTMVYVTHDQLEAMSMADRVMVMNHGIIEQVDTPQRIYDSPSTMYVADFIGSPPMSFLDASGALGSAAGAVRVGEGEVKVPAVARERAAGAVVVGARPEHVSLSGEGALRGRVYGSEYLGTTQIVSVETPGGMVRVRAAAGERASPGDSVGLDFRTERLSLFDPATGEALELAGG